MTQDEIIEMAIKSQLIYDKEAHTPWIEDTNLTPFLESFAKLVVEAEREACAKLCEDLSKDMTPIAEQAAKSCATLIRARTA